MKNLMVEPGSEAAPERFHMTITAGGPYLVFGHPPLRQQFMLPNRDGEIWYFQAGEKYSTESEPTALCRCGHSGDKPYCDGSHVRADWDPALTASEEPLLDGAERYEGPEVALRTIARIASSPGFAMRRDKCGIWSAWKGSRPAT